MYFSNVAGCLHSCDCCMLSSLQVPDEETPSFSTTRPMQENRKGRERESERRKRDTEQWERKRDSEGMKGRVRGTEKERRG